MKKVFNLHKIKYTSKENEGMFTMTIMKWVENKLTKEELYFNRLDEAIEHCKNETGKVKIYDHKRRICHSQERPREDSYC